MTKKRKGLVVEVVVSGEHTMVVPSGTEDLVLELFGNAGLTGMFTLYLGEKLPGSPHAKGIRVCNLINKRNIYFDVQPGGNETRHRLSFQSTEAIFNSLKQAEKQMTAQKNSDRWKRKMRKLYRALKGESFDSSKVPQKIIDDLGFQSPEFFHQTLLKISRSGIAISHRKNKCFGWRDSFVDEMAEKGYVFEEEEEEEEPLYTEEDNEEDRLVGQLLELEDVIKCCREAKKSKEKDLRDALAKQAEQEKVLQDLLQQVEVENQLFDQLRSAVRALEKDEDILVKKIRQLEGQYEEKNKRLKDLESASRISGTVAEMEALLDKLDPEEKKKFLARLASQIAPEDKKTKLVVVGKNG